MCGGCFSLDARLAARDVRTLLVGMNPADALPVGGRPAFVGSKSGDFIAKLCGVDAAALPTRFTLVNLFPADYVRAEAAARAADLKRDVVDGTFGRVILFGVEVRNAWRARDVGWFETTRCRQVLMGRDGPASTWEYDLTVMPHPSGRCRAWNDEAARQRGRQVMEQAWREAR